MKSINKLTKEVKDAAAEVTRIHQDSKKNRTFVALEREIEALIRQRDESLEVIRQGMGLKAAQEKVLAAGKALQLAKIQRP